MSRSERKRGQVDHGFDESSQPTSSQSKTATSCGWPSAVEVGAGSRTTPESRTGTSHVPESRATRGQQRRLLRRLYGAIEDDPELAQTYQSQFGRHRDHTRRDVLTRAREAGQLPEDTDINILLDLLTGAVWQHLAVYPDTSTPTEVERFLRAALHQAGYRPEGGPAERHNPTDTERS
ncbi:TetR-like C-terminal domain-containing protein [Plantactinospora sp. B5E13]|uniref:TetR-like C-terminal domain-containing protein n=1 Tax=Plantactinospora sp. B5E13 TaxID=3153758 RepID=UPI00325D0A30